MGRMTMRMGMRTGEPWALFMTWLMVASGLAAPFAPSGAGLAGEPPAVQDITGSPQAAPGEAFLQGFAGLDGFFTRNDGQVGDEGISYTYSSAGFDLAFMDGAVLMVLDNGRPAGDATAIRLTFDGCNPVAASGKDELAHYNNYFIGNDPSKWRTVVPSFGKIIYESIYEGIDLVYYFNEKGLKYDWKVAPQANPEAIVELFEGVDGLTIGPRGELSIVTHSGTLEMPRPFCYQYMNNERMAVPANFEVHGNSLRYRLGQYDAGRELVIDPLVFSTFLGASGTEQATAIAADSNGSAYVTGFTLSSDFPTTNGVYDKWYDGSEDVFVTKLSADGSKLEWSTFVGGINDDAGYGIEPLPNGDVVVSAYSYSNDFPTTSDCYDGFWNGNCDQVVFVLSSDARTLKRSTYIGGSGWDHGRLSVAPDGNFLICGYTGSDDFPATSGAYDTTPNGGYDIFVTKLKSDCSALIFSTYIGGSASDEASYTTSAFDKDGNIYVSGYTDSSDFPTTQGCYDDTMSPGYDVFVLKMDPTGTALLASTFIGGDVTEFSTGVIPAPGGDVIIHGSTMSPDFPTTPGAYDRSLSGGFDIFVCRFDGALTTLKSSTLVGGSDEEWSRGVSVDADGNFYAGGLSYSSDFPMTPGSYDSTHGGSADAILYMLSPDLSELLNSTYLGGSDLDEGNDMKMDSSNNLYLCGRVESSDFPVTNGAYDTTYNYGRDCCILKFSFLTNLPPTWLTIPTLRATEDVPFEQEFSIFVADPDTPGKDLRITSKSPYISAVSGLNVTFLFPDGVLSAMVPVNVSDGTTKVGATVRFDVTPINDPPMCSIGTYQTAVEDVPKTIDFAPYVSDVDSPRTSLGLLVDDPNATTDGLNLTVLFPMGGSKHTVPVEVSDGEASIQVPLNFSIIPVDDPPVVLPLPSFVAVEDRVSVFDLSPFVRDEDTPLHQLSLTVPGQNCTVDGLRMQFLFSRGGLDVDVPFEVHDAESAVPAVLAVRVTEVNDPPVVTLIPPMLVVEDSPSILDLSGYIMDEDTPRDGLVLESQDTKIVSVEGLYVTVLCPKWIPPAFLCFTVSDGIARTNGSFEVQVREVNDPPVISDIGGMAPPVSIALDEGGEVLLAVNASDEEGSRLKYTIASKWTGITVLANGTLRVRAAPGSVGIHQAELKVDDGQGGFAAARITVTVWNVNDPPAFLNIIQPANHTVVVEGTVLTFSINVSDPDLQFGQVLTATWASSLSGVFRTLNTTVGLSFATDELRIGTHRITVSVTDGQYTKEAWLVVEVTPRPSPPGAFPTVGGLPFPLVAAGIVALVLAAILAAAYVSRATGRRKNGKVVESLPVGGSATPASPADRASSPPPGTATPSIPKDVLGQPAGPALTRLAIEERITVEDLDDDESPLPAGRQEAPPATPAAEERPQPSGGGLLAEEPSMPGQMDQTAMRESRVLKALSSLPRGLPSTLWGMEMQTLASKVVSGERKDSPDGDLLVKIGNRWYYGDETNLGLFMQEFKK